MLLFGVGFSTSRGGIFVGRCKKIKRKMATKKSAAPAPENSTLKAIEQDIARCIKEGKPIPPSLSMRVIYALAEEERDPKKKADLYIKAASLSKGQELASTPKSVLAKIAQFKMAGITPYHPSME